MVLAKEIRCMECEGVYPANAIIFECEKCDGPLDLVYDYHKIQDLILEEHFIRDEINHWKYWPFYPIKHLHKIVTLHEGGTPLLDSRQKKKWKFKYEAVNPTGSFKDRGTTIEISKAMELGVQQVLCASTGNMGASVAAYAARAGIKATIYLPDFVGENKCKQMLAYGAEIKKIKGSYQEVVRLTQQMNKQKGLYLTGDYPYRGEGEKSVGFEILDQLHFRTPDYIVCPAGNATLLSGVFKACREFKKVGLIEELPKLIAVQAEGCNPLVRAWQNKTKIREIKNPETIASAINCGKPVDGIKALLALKQTKGDAVAVTDKEMIVAMKELGKEGLYVEPSGAASYAGAKKLELKGEVVCVLTGHGLKEEKSFT